MVNFLSIFCQDLQKLLKPIYNLTRKGRPFLWQQRQQTAFEEIKSRLQKPPILHLPDEKGRFHLYSDTSKHAIGSALYQIQIGKPKLITYASKRGSKKLLHNRIRNVWISHKYHKLCTFTKESRL